MNAKQEFLEEIKDKKLVCAKIGLDRENWGKPDWKILKPNYSQEDFDSFCKELDFEYDSLFGSQEFFGIILFEDSYSDRIDRAEFIEATRERLIYIREILSEDGGLFIHRINNII